MIRCARIEFPARARKGFCVRHGFGKAGGCLFHLGPAIAVPGGNGFENATKARPAHGVVRREIGAAEKRASIGEKKSGQRPAALPRNRADRSLVTRVHVGPFVAVHFHRNE
jgi:hypothetical protein